MSRCIEVAVQDANLFYDKLYTYAVPARLEGHIFVGSTVLCPFGRGRTKPRVGVVVEFSTAEKPGVRIKEIIDAAQNDEPLSDEALGMVRYLKSATFCTWYEALRAVLPYGAQYEAVEGEAGWQLQSRLRRTTQRVYRLADAPPLDARTPSSKQQLVLDLLAEGPLPLAEICSGCGVGPGVADTLVRNGWLLYEDADLEPVVEPEAPPAPEVPEGGYTLNEQQQAVFEGLMRQMQQAAPGTALLHGVTGSGKTALFLALAREVLRQGKGVLLLVPEIGLTGQMIGRLRAAFGEEVAVQHSGLSRTERLMQWRAIRAGRTHVVVGTRSAVFAPLANIGLIVADEEQERSYQSESAPRYDALEVARRRAARHNALLLLASATPSVASYYAAQQGRYTLYELKHRYGELPLPEVEMVDMHDELLSGNAASLSDRLAAEMDEVLAGGGQVILLLNRRGYHRVARCKACGEILRCEDCSVPMIYHRAGPAERASQEASSSAAPPQPAAVAGEVDPLALWKKIAPKPSKIGGEAPVQLSGEGGRRMEGMAGLPGGSGRLLCHYCGRSIQPAPEHCPACGGEMQYYGVGTQHVEDELERRFPNARVLRLDADTTSRKGSHARLLAAFGRGEYDILLGTQMVAKGLDFERVRLVGVIGIDSLLFSPGYRAQEHVFSLVTQVVGRAGRTGQQGRALIQTMDPENPVLTLAARQDYPAFYQQEIEFRRQMLYPPLCAICLVVFIAPGGEEDAVAASRAFAGILTQRAQALPGMPLRVLGPAPMTVAQVGGSWRWRLTIKCRNDEAFRSLLGESLVAYQKGGWLRKVPVYVDFNADADQ